MRHRSLLQRLTPLRRLALLASLVLLHVGGAAGADSRPLLWRVDGPQPAYLFGTIHSAHPDLNHLPDAVENALTQADRFYAELALDGATQARIQTLFSQPAGQRLSDQLTAAQRARIEGVLRGIQPGLSLAAFDSLQLWAFTLTLGVLEDQLSYPGAAMMDRRLYLSAERQGKPRGGLETPEEQAGVFSRLDRAEQHALLDATLSYLERAQAEGHATQAEGYRIYREGDPNQFLNLFSDQLDVPLLLQLKLQRLLLTERNERMAKRIAGLLDTHPRERLFFAIGAAHFADTGGIPARLREMGYRVRRVGSAE